MGDVLTRRPQPLRKRWQITEPPLSRRSPRMTTTDRFSAPQPRFRAGARSFSPASRPGLKSRSSGAARRRSDRDGHRVRKRACPAVGCSRLNCGWETRRCGCVAGADVVRPPAAASSLRWTVGPHLESARRQGRRDGRWDRRHGHIVGEGHPLPERRRALPGPVSGVCADSQSRCECAASDRADPGPRVGADGMKELRSCTHHGSRATKPAGFT